MSRVLQTIYVTHHALQRWRERVATYGDEGHAEIEAALRAAVPLGDEPLAFPRWDGMRYYRHAEKSDVYFVTEPRGFDSEAVVTIIDISPLFVKPPPAKTAVQEWENDPPKKVPPKQKSAPPQNPAHAPVREPNPGFEPVFADIAERRDWILGEYADAQLMLSRLSKKHPQRPAWLKRHNSLQLQIRELRGEYSAFLTKREREANPIRDFTVFGGAMNHDDAICYLLGEVRRLGAEVAALKDAAMQQVA